MNTTFEWAGQKLDYFSSEYNTTILNERAVEIPIARHWLGGVHGAGLEVGNVLGHYPLTVVRTVVDLNEHAAGVTNIDLFDIEGTYDWIVTISTLEHVRWDGPVRDPHGAVDAIAHLRTLLNPGGRMLATIPFGHNPGLDAAILNGNLAETTSTTMLLTAGEWIEHPGAVFAPYGALTNWAGAVWIAEFAPTGFT